MKVSTKLLKQFIDFDLDSLDIKNLADKLTMNGLPVSEFENKNGDTLLDIEITANRGDCASILGIAREVAIILGKEIKLDKFSLDERTFPSSDYSVEIFSFDDCPRYLGRLIKDVKIKPSPDWLREKLEICGIRPINNVVDITNYIMLEIGQPMHAFDADKIKGKAIKVRRAVEGEVLFTLDEKLRELNKNFLVISDTEKVIALAGVIGGKETEITSDTRNIFLESAYFNPSLISYASQKLKLITESSYRFARSVDYNNVIVALDKATSLIKEIAEGKIVYKKIDCQSIFNLPQIKVNFKEVNQLLGINIDFNKQKEILRKLNFSILKEEDNSVLVCPPSYRNNIKNQINVAEEIARIYGYQHIPISLPAVNLIEIQQEKSLKVEKLIKQFFINKGVWEVITFSLVKSEKETLTSQQVKILNPLSENQNCLRDNFLFGLLKVAQDNIFHQKGDIKIFEKGRIFRKKNNRIEEKEMIGGVFTGRQEEEHWLFENKLIDIYYAYGMIESLFKVLKISALDEVLDGPDFLEKGCCKTYKIANEEIAVVGKVNSEITAEFEFPDEVYYFEIDFNSLMKNLELEKKYKKFSPFPEVKKDIAIIVSEDMLYRDIFSIIKKTGGELIKEIILFDVYRGEGIPENNKSLAYHIVFQSAERTLTDEEINQIFFKIIEELEKNPLIKVRKK